MTNTTYGQSTATSTTKHREFTPRGSLENTRDWDLEAPEGGKEQMKKEGKANVGRKKEKQEGSIWRLNEGASPRATARSVTRNWTKKKGDVSTTATREAVGNNTW